MPEIKTKQVSDVWIASVWIARKVFTAKGKTKEEAVLRLKDHLKNLIPIYENTIEWTQEIMKGIKEIISESAS